jgi:hypothetical protein
MTEGEKRKNATPDNISQEKLHGHIYLMKTQLIAITVQNYHYSYLAALSKRRNLLELFLSK